MPEYIVFVMPPSDEDAEPFDIPEWEFDAAMATASVVRRHALSITAHRSCRGALGA